MQGPYNDAIDKLHRHENDPNKAKLTKPECAAVLTLGFDSYTSGSKTVSTLRNEVAAIIAKDHANATVQPPFFAKMKARKARGDDDEEASTSAVPKKKRARKKAPNDGGAGKKGKKDAAEGAKKAKATKKTGDAKGGTKRKRDEPPSEGGGGGCDGKVAEV